MNTRRVVWVASIVLFGGLACWGTIRFWPAPHAGAAPTPDAGTAPAPASDEPPGVTSENFKRLQSGMTTAEAEAILGGPGRWMGDPKCMTARHAWNWKGKTCSVVLDIRKGKVKGGILMDAPIPLNDSEEHIVAKFGDGVSWLDYDD